MRSEASLNIKTSKNKPHILLVVARGEAVRNFLYSDMLPVLHQHARVTLLTLVDHGEVIDRVKPYVDRIIPLKEYRERKFVTALRYFVHTAHYRWLWSENAKHMWALHRARAVTPLLKIRRVILEAFSNLFAHRNTLALLTRVSNWLTWQFRPTRDFDALFRDLAPDLIFNCSHIHGPQADLPMLIAHKMNFATAAFIFSWDNLTTRSRIFVPYNYYLMWNDGMKSLLLKQYAQIRSDQVIVTGTPQFDFHFKMDSILTRDELGKKIGFDPARPFLLYTTGMDTDFLDEHKFILEVIRIIRELKIEPKPQLVVRTYIKGTSPEIIALSKEKIPDVYFPPVLWDKQWIMPLREDLSIYSSLLHHCAMGINPASTVTLELMMLDKPVINIGMEPPGSNLPAWEKFSRHVDYEHYRPVAESGGVMVARSISDLEKMIYRGLTQPSAQSEKREAFMTSMMDGTLDGRSGERVAKELVRLARMNHP
jgi:hypothetical protein